MNGFEIDYASVRSAGESVREVAHGIGRCTVPQVAAGPGTYGFPVLSRAAAAFGASVSESVDALARDCANVADALEDARTAYRESDDDAADRLGRLADGGPRIGPRVPGGVGPRPL